MMLQRMRYGGYISFGVLSLLFVAAYWVPLRGMAHLWLTNEDYSYGMMVPLVTVYLLWERRSELRLVRIRPSWPMLPLLLVVVLLSLYGILGSSGNIAMPAVPLVIILLTAFLCGPDTVRVFWLPLSFLFFMVPLPAIIERSLGVFLKSVATQLGGAVIRICGLSVNISGNIIDLGVTQLQVVDACSGLRFLLPLLAIGVLYSHYFVSRRWQKICCVLATLPIAVISNGLRIGITGILANYYGTVAAEGFFHDFEGWVIFMVSFFLLFLFSRMLRLISPGRVPEGARPKGLRENSAGETAGSGAVALLVATLLLVGVSALSWGTTALPPVNIRGGIADFPLAFGGWQGRAAVVPPQVVADSGAEEAFNARYVKEGVPSVSLYLGFRSTAFLETENFFHSPTVCLPASGWENSRTVRRVITTVPVFGALPVTEMVAGNLGNRYLVYFWFQTKNRATADKNVNRFHLARHAIERDNTYDIFARTITAIAPTESDAAAEARLDGYVREMMGAMTAFLRERVR